MLVYRAAEGEPPVRLIANSWCKIEILGRGQYFLAYELQGYGIGDSSFWSHQRPRAIPITSVPAITEAQVTTFLERCAARLGIELPPEDITPLVETEKPDDSLSPPDAEAAGKAPNHEIGSLDMPTPAAADAERLEFHPLAAIFPLPPPAEFEAFVADIREHGVIDPITVYENKVLDGRRRYLAAKQVAKERPEILAKLLDDAEIYKGNDPLGYVISKNLRRRQMSAGARATSAARLANLPPHRPGGDKRAILPTSVTLADAATIFGVSERYIKYAKVALVARQSGLDVSDNQDEICDCAWGR